jgi:hypothetical protein
MAGSVYKFCTFQVMQHCKTIVKLGDHKFLHLLCSSERELACCCCCWWLYCSCPLLLLLCFLLNNSHWAVIIQTIYIWSSITWIFWIAVTTILIQVSFQCLLFVSCMLMCGISTFLVFNHLVFVCTAAWKFMTPGKQISASNYTRPQASKHNCFCHNVDRLSKYWNNFGMLTFRITSIINAHIQYYMCLYVALL